MHPFQKVLDPPSGAPQRRAAEPQAFPPEPGHVLQQEPAPLCPWLPPSHQEEQGHLGSEDRIWDPHTCPKKISRGAPSSHYYKQEAPGVPAEEINLEWGC